MVIQLTILWYSSTANLIEQVEKGLAILFNTDSYYNSWENNLTGYPPHYMYKVILLLFVGFQSHCTLGERVS